MSIPFDFPVGRILIHAERRIRFDSGLGEGVLRFSDLEAVRPAQATPLTAAQ